MSIRASHMWPECYCNIIVWTFKTSYNYMLFFVCNLSNCYIKSLWQSCGLVVRVIIHFVTKTGNFETKVRTLLVRLRFVSRPCGLFSSTFRIAELLCNWKASLCVATVGLEASKKCMFLDDTLVHNDWCQSRNERFRDSTRSGGNELTNVWFRRESVP